MNSTAKTIMGWGLAIACCLLIYTVMTKNAGSGGKVTDIGYSDLLDKTEAGQVYDATIQGNEVRGHLKGSKDEFRTTVYANTIDTLTKEMHAAKVRFDLKPEQTNFPLQLLVNLGPFVLLIAIWFFFHAADAVGGQQGAVLRQEPRAPALDAAEEDHLQGRGRRG